MSKTRKYKKNNPRWPPKYYAGLTAKQAAARRKEILKYGALPSSDRRAYVGFKTDRGIKTRTSSYTAQWRRRFPRAKSLAQKAAATGVPVRTLKASYDRGLAAWRTGHRPGATGQQWGYARVHSFLLCGKTHYGPDSDLVRAAKAKSASARRWFAQCKASKTTKGGALLAQGRHGAVFSPPLPCLPEFQGAAYVSKLTDNNREAQNEIRKSAEIRRLDPDQRYTCPVLATCVPSADVLAAANTAEVVKYYQIQSPILLYYTHCGKSYESYLRNFVYDRTTAAQIPPLMRALIVLIREFILPTLHANSYVHGDLHAGNIVFSEAEGRARLVDFDWLILPADRAKYPERIEQVDLGFLASVMISLVEAYLVFGGVSDERREAVTDIIDDLYYNYGSIPDQARLLPGRRGPGYTLDDFMDDMGRLEEVMGV